MATQLSVYNDACVWLGERKLATVSDNVDIRKTLDAIYAKEVLFCLEQGFWNFATRSIETTASVTVTPSFGYANAFDKPSDWVRTTVISGSNTFKPPLLQYTDEGGVWYADVTPLYIKYVSSDDTYGNNLTIWPTTFADFVALRLAFRACPRTTQNESKLQMITKELKLAQNGAVAKDGMNNPADFPPAGSWTASRSGGRGVRSTATGMSFR